MKLLGGTPQMMAKVTNKQANSSNFSHSSSNRVGSAVNRSQKHQQVVNNGTQE